MENTGNTNQDPTQKYQSEPFEEQQQDVPGTEAELQPKANCRAVKPLLPGVIRVLAVLWLLPLPAKAPMC
jgi:hypothetical protein